MLNRHKPGSKRLREKENSSGPNDVPTVVIIVVSAAVGIGIAVAVVATRRRLPPRTPRNTLVVVRPRPHGKHTLAYLAAAPGRSYRC